MSEMKSAYEIAMERLRKKDAEDGVEHTPLTDEQKAAIAEVKQFYQAKLAQQDVLHLASLRKTFDPEERAKLNENGQREREKFVAERERKIERIRGQ